MKWNGMKWRKEGRKRDQTAKESQQFVVTLYKASHATENLIETVHKKDHWNKKKTPAYIVWLKVLLFSPCVLYLSFNVIKTLEFALNLTFYIRNNSRIFKFWNYTKNVTNSKFFCYTSSSKLNDIVVGTMFKAKINHNKTERTRTCSNKCATDKRSPKNKRLGIWDNLNWDHF